MSDIEGKTAREAASEFQSIDKSLLPSIISRLRSMKPTAVSSLLMNGADGISDIEGKATRVGASERGQRTSFNDPLLAAWPAS